MNKVIIEVFDLTTCSAVKSALKTIRKMIGIRGDYNLLTLAGEAFISIRGILPDAILTETASGYGIIYQSVILMEFTRAEK